MSGTWSDKMAGFNITSNKRERTWKIAVMQAAAVFGVQAAMLCAYFSVFDVGVEEYQAILLLGITVSVPLFLLWSKTYRRQKVTISFIVLGILAAVFWSKIYEGIVPHINNYTELRNKFYGSNNPLIEVESDLFSRLLTLALLQFLLSCLLFTILEARHGIVMAVMVFLLPVIVAATVGKMPETLSCFALIAMGCIYIIVYHRSGDRFPIKHVIGVLGGLVVLWGCSLIFKPVILQYKQTYIEEYQTIKMTLTQAQLTNLKELKDSVSEVVSEIGVKEGNYATGGVAEGDLSGVTSFRPSGDKAMEIIVTKRPSESIYLKAFVGTTYTGKEWEKLGALEFAKIILPIGGVSDKRSLMGEPFRRISEGENGLREQQMKIQLEGASSKYAYTPYYTEITRDHSVYADAYIEGDGEKAREYTYYPVEDVESTYAELAEASNLWEEYQEFVKETYVKEYPELEELTALCESWDKGYLKEKINQRFQGLRYTEEPGEMPKDRDFVEGFLFEKKEGVCVHFATAATLIYQMSGVPARYVEGYTVKPNQFIRLDDGTYKAVVTDASAHAWCEIFDEEYGWQVREHTLIYGRQQPTDSEIPHQDDGMDEPIEETVPDTMTQEESMEELQEEQGMEQDGISGSAEMEDERGDGKSQSNGLVKNVKKIILVGCVIIGSLFALAIVIVLQQKIRRGKRMMSFRQKKENRGITSIYNSIYEMCVFAGLEKVEETERERIARMVVTFAQLTEEEWNWIYLQAEQAAFSGKVFTANEQKELYHLYRKLRRELLKTFSWWKRMWFLYGRAM